MAVSSTPIKPKPTFVLVSGAWHGIEYWAMVAAALKVQGYVVRPVALRTASPDPNLTFMDDLTAVRDVIREETKLLGRDVVVAAHSLGSVIGASAIKGFTAMTTEESLAPTNNGHNQDAGDGQATTTTITVAAPSFSIASQGQENGAGHVIGFVTIATGFLPAGTSFYEVLGGAPPHLWRFSSKPKAMTTEDDDVGDDGVDSTTRIFATLRVPARQAFYGDMAVEEGERWVARLLPQNAATITTGEEHVHAGWLDVPCWSLVATEDRAFPYEGQMASLQAARDAGADIWSEEIAASHSPMLSRPNETADFLRRAAMAFREKASSLWRK
ncbi:Alpha/beta hydrolase fold-1 [Apiospora kogelbergensis]|uniref:Alpha/beta hydrolase fold-1 n=1 Tax=Apiospora kogelbergensis TaxID=1337665 RepID=A0AAW0R439_9PEZI